METVDMIADNPGIWLFHCHISDHMAGGMTARYNVTQ
jgi:FtsP/CotA-like multicopper oxidase with cupredoxin domain